MVSFQMTFIVSRLNGIIPNDIYCKSFEWYHSKWHLLEVVWMVSFQMTFIVSRLNGIIPNDIYCKSFEWYHSKWHLL